MSNELFVISAMLAGFAAFPCCMFAGIALQTWWAKHKARRAAAMTKEKP